MTRKEGVDTAVEHAAGEVLHDRLGLEMEVVEHFVGPPAANQADEIRVDAGKEK